MLAGVRPPSSRIVSGSSRNTSASSISTNSSRAPSAASYYRPQTAMSHLRTASYEINPLARSNTAFDDYEGDSQPTASKRKGMPLFSISALQQQDRLRPRKQRDRTENSGSYIPDTSREPAPRSQSPFRIVSAEKSLSRNVSLSTAFENLSLQTQCSEVRDSMFPSPQKDQVCPKTPSYIPKIAPKTPRPVQAPQPYKTPLTKYKVSHASPTKLTFLTRESNTPAPAWDTKGRLEDMESLYSQLKGQFEGAAFEKTGLEESLQLYKTRREHSLYHRKIWMLTMCNQCMN